MRIFAVPPSRLHGPVGEWLDPLGGLLACGLVSGTLPACGRAYPGLERCELTGGSGEGGADSLTGGYEPGGWGDPLRSLEQVKP